MSEAGQFINMMIVFGMMLGIIIAAMIYLAFCGGSGRRTKGYRKDLTNLYVAGKIKEIANKEGIKISEEYESFKQFVKKRRMEDWDLDVVIEEELKEKVTEAKKEVKKEGIK